MVHIAPRHDIGCWPAVAFMVPIPVAERGTEKGGFCLRSRLACGFVYLFSLLATYLFVLNEQEAVGLASYARYWGTMSTALLLYFTGRLLLALARKQKKAYKSWEYVYWWGPYFVCAIIDFG